MILNRFTIYISFFFLNERVERVMFFLILMREIIFICIFADALVCKYAKWKRGLGLGTEMMEGLGLGSEMLRQLQFFFRTEYYDVYLAMVIDFFLME